MFMCNGRAGVVDLGTGDSAEQELPEELLMKGSALEVVKALHEEHPDSLVLGSGLLTGSLVPAACAGLVACGGKVMPLMGHLGVELKLSGFDFIVAKGTSARPVYLWARDGMVELVDGAGLAAADSWTRTERIRADQGDRRIQVLATGPWGDASRAGAALTVNHWLGEDDLGLATEFGARGLVAAAFRGMGELEVADSEGHLSASVRIREGHVSRLGTSTGLASYWDKASDAGFGALLHRVSGCFGCPYPCRSFLKVNEDPGQMALVHKEPGYLHYDIPSLEAALGSGFSARDATLASMACAKAGADPCAVIGSGARDLSDVGRALASGEASAFDRSSAPGSFKSYPDFDRCVGLGLCPRYWSKTGLDLGALAESVEKALGRPLP